MRKEVLFAILAGLGLGLVVAFGVWRANLALSPKDKSQAEASPTPKPEFAITLAEPADLDVFTENPVSVSGITKAGSHVAISAEEEDYYVKADTKGAFEIEIELIGGVNEIVITAFDEKGSEVTQKLLLVYSTEFEKYLPSVEQGENVATDSVREKVEQKVSEALNSPKAQLGTVTDISESTLQVKTASGEIKQLSVNSETSVIKTGTISREVKITDVAIGDYIVAMGFANGNGVLNTKRILITSPFEASGRRAILARVTKVTLRDLTAQFIRTGEEQTVTPQRGATVYLINADKVSKITFSRILVDDTFLGIGLDSNNSFSVRTFYIVSRP